MFQGVRYLRMCIIPITFPEKLGNVYGNVLESLLDKFSEKPLKVM